MRKQIANYLTGCRMICSIFMLFFPVFSSGFMTLYLFCGFSDMVDGTIARKTNSVNDFGAKLDTTADILFMAVSLVKFLPVIQIQTWLWIWIAVIAIMKISTMLRILITEKTTCALHTTVNKITGLLLFLLPLTLPFLDLRYSAAIICSTATFSAVQELFTIRTGHDFNT